MKTKYETVEFKKDYECGEMPWWCHNNEIADEDAGLLGAVDVTHDGKVIFGQQMNGCVLTAANLHDIASFMDQLKEAPDADK